MKKNELVDEWDFSYLTKTFRIMRITLFLMLAVILQTFANEAYSQKTKLSLDYTNTKLEVVLDDIENLTEFFFLANEKLVDLNRSVNLLVKNKKIDEILDMLFAGTDVVYTITDRKIILAPSFLAEDAQFQQSVSGKVTDSSNQPLPGVTILIKGTTQGTVTNADGNYSLFNISDDATLVFSFVGMRTQELVVGTQRSIDVRMEEDVIGLEEVIAVGYGIQKRSDVTASISSIRLEELEDMPVANALIALQGKFPGVNIQQTAGDLGKTPAIKIRGIGSISAGNTPLIVIDGNMVSSSIFTNMSPSEIESIDVLKDASSTAIYGSRGSNGVILVTTKRGKTGKPAIHLDVYTGFQQVAKKIELLNSQEMAEFNKEAYNTSYLIRVPGASISDPNSVRPHPFQQCRYPQGDLFDWLDFDDPQKVTNLPYTNWQDEIFQNAPISNYQLSTTGGSDKIKYYIMGGYLKQDGIILTSSMDRYIMRSNIDININARFRIGLDINSSYRLNNDVNAEGHNAQGGIIMAALAMPPYVPIYKDDGTYNSLLTYTYSYGWADVNNPIANVLEQKIQTRTLGFLGNAYAEYDIFNNLKYRISGNIASNSIRTNTYRTSKIPWNFQFPPTQAVGTATSGMNMSWVFNQILNFNQTFNEVHDMGVLVGMEATKYYSESSSVQAIDFPNDIVETLNAGKVNDGSSFITENSVFSYFSRLNYSFKEKYLINLSIRTDGSSLFGPENRWGIFPAGSIGWRFHNEPFMQNLNFLSEAKLRLSYGYSGNNAFSSNYPYIGLLSASNYVIGDKLATGLLPTTLENQELGWEKSRQVDIGIDIGLFNHRIYFIADYYQRKTVDLLLDVNVPNLTGYAISVQNIGKVENKGCEFALTTKNITGKLTWETDFNISLNRNKVVALGESGDPILRDVSGGPQSFITKIGEPIGSYFGYKQIGIFQDQDDLDSYPHWENSQPGDVKFEDANEDLKIDADDRTIIGNNQPDFIYGLSNNFFYKGFNLDIVITGVRGNDILSIYHRIVNNSEGYGNQLSIVNDRWRSANDPGNGITPRANRSTTGNNNQISSRWVEDGSFTRLQNVTLGYQFPQKISGKLKISKARIYLSGQNLITWTDFLGYNPEVSEYENALTGGVDYGTYPVSKTFSVGLNLIF